MSKTKQITFAEKAKQINKRYKNRDSNAQEMRGWEIEMENLMRQQERARLKELAIQSLKNYQKPTNASKYETGGPLNFNPTGNYQDNRFLPLPSVPTTPAVPDSPLYPNPFQSNPDTATYTTPVPNVADGLKDGIYQPDRLPQLPIKPIVPGQIGTNSTPQVGEVQAGIQDRTSGGNMYTPLAVGKGIEFAGKLAMLADGYDKVKPQYNPNESRVESLMADRNIDTAALENNALSQQNVALANLSDVRSPNVKRALVQNAIQGTLRNLQDTKLQENQMRNQYSSDYANTLNNLGQQRSAAEVYAENLNTQSKSNYQQGLQNMLLSVGELGQGLTNKAAHTRQSQLVGKFLFTKDFTAGNLGDLITKAERGEEVTQDDFIKLYASKGKSAQQASADWEEYRKSLFK